MTRTPLFFGRFRNATAVVTGLELHACPKPSLAQDDSAGPGPRPSVGSSCGDEVSPAAVAATA